MNRTKKKNLKECMLKNIHNLGIGIPFQPQRPSENLKLLLHRYGHE
jgi:hypothetical protein